MVQVEPAIKAMNLTITCTFGSSTCAAFLAVVLGIASVVLTMVGSIGCSTFEIRYTNTSSSVQTALPEYTNSIIEFSPYKYAFTDAFDERLSPSCRDFPSSFNYDRKFKSAGILPIVSWVVAGINILSLLCLYRTSRDKLPSTHKNSNDTNASTSQDDIAKLVARESFLKKIGNLFCYFNTMFNALIFLIFRSSTCNYISSFISSVYDWNVTSGILDCAPGPGFPYAVAGICGYFITGLVCHGGAATAALERKVIETMTAVTEPVTESEVNEEA